MQPTFGNYLEEIENYYDRRLYQKVITSSGKLVERMLGFIFSHFHTSLKTREERQTFLSFEEKGSQNYEKFVHVPTIGVGIGFYLKLCKLFPDHPWLQLRIKDDLNTVNQWRNLESHTNQSNQSGGVDKKTVRDNDAATVLQSTEEIIDITGLKNTSAEKEDLTLENYLDIVAIKTLFESEHPEDHYKTIIHRSITLAITNIRYLLDRLYPDLLVEGKRALLDFYFNWLEPVNQKKEFRLLAEAFGILDLKPNPNVMQSTETINNLKESFKRIGNIPADKYSRRATSPYVDLLEIIARMLTGVEDRKVLQLGSKIWLQVQAKGVLSAKEKTKLQGIADHEGISEAILEDVINSIESLIKTRPDLFSSAGERGEVAEAQKTRLEEQPTLTEEDLESEREELLYGGLGPLIIQIVAVLWLSPRENGETLELKDLLREHGGAKAVGRGLSAFQSLEEGVVDLLKPLLLECGNTNEQLSSLNTVYKILQSRVPSRPAVEACLRNPRLLLQHFKATDAKTPPSDNEDAVPTVCEQLLLQISELIIDLFEALPAWKPENLMDLLGNKTIMLKRSKEILSDWNRSTAQTNRDSILQFEAEFRREIARRFDELNLFGIDVSNESKKYQLSVAYISLSIELSEQSDPLAMEEDIPVEKVLEEFPRLVILGDAGQGKTTLMQWITVMCGRQSFPGQLAGWNKKIPFLVRLRNILDRELPAFHELVPLMATQIPTDDERYTDWALEILNTGNAIVMLDGFDEVPQEKRKEMINWLDSFCQKYPDNRFMLTSRPSSYTKENNIDFLGFKKVKLQPLTPSAMRAFIMHWHRAVSLVINPINCNYLDEEAEQLMDELTRKKSLRLLVNNPLLCGVICALHHDRHGYLPNNRTEIYEATCQMFMERRDLERKVTESEPGLQALSYTDKRVFLNDVANWMMMNGKTVIQKEQILKRLSQKIEYLPILKEKGLSAKSLLKYFLERSGLLQQIGKNDITFAHRTFQEYMAAKAFVDNDSIDFLKNQAGDDYWNETILLVLGLCSNYASNNFVLSLLKTAGQLEKSGQYLKATRLYLLVMRGCETIRQIHPTLLKAVEQKIEAIIPPYAPETRAAIVASAELALPFLTRKPGRTVKDDLYCAITLLQMRVQEAYSILLGYFLDERPEFIDNLSALLRKVDRKVLEQTELVELILRKGPPKYPLKIIESLVFVSKDYRLYKSFPEKHFKEASGVLKVVKMELSSDFDWYLPPDLDVSFFVKVSDSKYLPSIHHLVISRLILPSVHAEDMEMLQDLHKLKYLIIARLDNIDLLEPLNQLALQKDCRIVIRSITVFSDDLNRLASSIENPPEKDSRKITVEKVSLSHLSSEAINIVEYMSALAGFQKVKLHESAISVLTKKGSPTRGHALQYKLQFALLFDLSKLAETSGFHLSINQLSFGGGEYERARTKQINTILENITDIRKLEISHWSALSGKAFSLASVGKLDQLVDLDLCHTKVRDVKPLAKLKSLKKLSLKSTEVTDLSPLSELTQLQSLNLSRVGVTDIFPLQDLHNLTTLDLKYTYVRDLSSLKHLDNLKVLDILHTKVKSLDSLKQLSGLESIFASTVGTDIASFNERYGNMVEYTNNGIMITIKKSSQPGKN